MTLTHERSRHQALLGTLASLAVTACDVEDDASGFRSIDAVSASTSLDGGDDELGESTDASAESEELAPGELPCVYQKTTGSMIWRTNQIASNDALGKGGGFLKDQYYYFNDVWCEATEPKMECPEGQVVDMKCGEKLSSHLYLTQDTAIKCPLTQNEFDTAYAVEDFKKEWTIKMLMDGGSSKEKAEQDWKKVQNAGLVFAFYCASKMNQQAANQTSFADGCKGEAELKTQIAKQGYTCKAKEEPEPSVESETEGGSCSDDGSWSESGESPIPMPEPIP